MLIVCFRLLRGILNLCLPFITVFSRRTFISKLLVFDETDVFVVEHSLIRITAMFLTKRDVDKHCQEVMSKCKTEKDVSIFFLFAF